MIKDIDSISTEQDSKQRIETKESNKAKDKSNQNSYKILIAVILIAIAIIIISLIKISSHHQTNTINYNGYQFFKESHGFWATQLQKQNNLYTFVFFYNPKELNSTYMDNRVLTEIMNLNKSQYLFLAIDKDLPVNISAPSFATTGAVEISRLYKYKFLNVPTRGVVFDKEMSLAQIKNQSTLTNLNCKIASNNTVIIRYLLGNITSIYYKAPHCIYLEAKEPEDFRKLSDLLAYKILRVMT